MGIITVKKTKKVRHHIGSRITTSILLLIVVIGVANYLRPIPNITATAISSKRYPVSPTSVSWPSYGQAAIATAQQGVIATAGVQTPLATASIAKIITALCILEKYPLAPGQTGPTFNVSDADVALYANYLAKEGSVVQVEVGEQLSEYQLLQAMLLPSSNNLADSAAIWAYGSLDRYSSFANNFVATHGLTNTHIGIDASGFDGTTTSTATDLARLGALAIAQPILVEIAAQPVADLPVVGTVYNYNGALGQEGIFGLKTGNNDQDLGAFLFAAKVTVGTTSVTVTGAIMGASSLREALESSLPLLKSVQANFSEATVIHKDQVFGTFHTAWGASAQAVADTDVTVVRWNAEPINVTASLKNLTLTSSQNSVGQVDVSLPSHSLNTLLKLDHELPGPSFLWRLTRH